VVSNPIFAYAPTAACLLLVMLVLSACDESIVHNLSEYQANRIRVALSRSGIEAQKKREGAAWRIDVPSDVATDALSTMDYQRLTPERSASSLPDSTGSLMESREERSFNLERRISLELAQTLERMPGVLEARVHLYRQIPRSPFSSESLTHSSASVLLLSDMTSQADSERVKMIVSGASGIGAESISVVVSEDSSAKLKRDSDHQMTDEKAGQKEPTTKRALSNNLTSLVVLPLAFGALVFFYLNRREVTSSLADASRSSPEREDKVEPDLTHASENCQNADERKEPYPWVVGTVSSRPAQQSPEEFF